MAGKRFCDWCCIALRDLTPDLIALRTDPAVPVLAKLTSLNLPAAMAAAEILAANGKNSLIREGALTGLRGREGAFSKQLAGQLPKKKSATKR